MAAITTTISFLNLTPLLFRAINKMVLLGSLLCQSAGVVNLDSLSVVVYARLRFSDFQEPQHKR